MGVTLDWCIARREAVVARWPDIVVMVKNLISCKLHRL